MRWAPLRLCDSRSVVLECQQHKRMPYATRRGTASYAVTWHTTCSHKSFSGSHKIALRALHLPHARTMPSQRALFSFLTFHKRHHPRSVSSRTFFDDQRTKVLLRARPSPHPKRTALSPSRLRASLSAGRRTRIMQALCARLASHLGLDSRGWTPGRAAATGPGAQAGKQATDPDGTAVQDGGEASTALGADALPTCQLPAAQCTQPPVALHTAERARSPQSDTSDTHTLPSTAASPPAAPLSVTPTAPGASRPSRGRKAVARSEPIDPTSSGSSDSDDDCVVIAHHAAAEGPPPGSTQDLVPEHLRATCPKLSKASPYTALARDAGPFCPPAQPRDAVPSALLHGAPPAPMRKAML